MKRQFVLLLCLGGFLTSGSVAMFPGSGQVTAPPKYTRPEIDFKNFPIVEPAGSSPSGEAKAIRARKSKKYNNKSLSEISEASNVTFLVNEALSSLSALPVDKSSVVLIGRRNCKHIISKGS